MGYASPTAAGDEGYAASADVLVEHPAEETTALTFYKKAEFELLSELSPTSILRFMIDINSVTGATCYASWRINGVEWFQRTDNTGSYVTKSNDKTRTWKRGDKVSLYAASTWSAGLVKNIKICGVRSPFTEL